MTAVHLKFGDDGRAAVLRGAGRLVEAMAITLGPKGRTVLIEGIGGAAPRVTKDGVTVADALEEGGRFDQLGLRLIRRAAQRVGEEIGDGTTTTAVLAYALIAEAQKAAAAGLDLSAVRHGVQLGAANVVAELRRRAVPVDGHADLERIATISANGEGALGKAIADAYHAVGAEGALTVMAGNTLETTWERLSGLQWEGGYFSPYFMTDAATTECVYENPLILLTDATLDSHATLLKPLEVAVKQRRPLLVVAEALKGEALQTLIANKLRNNLRVVAGKAPLFGDRRRAMLEDTATVIGGRLVSESRGDNLASIDPAALGAARRIVLTKDRTKIVGGAGTEVDIAARAAGILAEQRLEGNTPFQNKLLRERLARLTGGVAIVHIGGASDTEIGERTDRANDAAQAVRAALADGVLPGGGAAFVHAARILVPDETLEDRAAIAILRKALFAPSSRIATNAGVEGDVVAARIAASDQFAYGYDARSGRFRDLVAAGIIDPARVAIGALESAVSVAALMLSTETVVAKPAPASRPTSADDIPFGPEAKDMTAEEAASFGLV